MAVPLHNHTYYSAYDGLSKPIEIANRCAELGYGACACTDHDLVSGHPEFVKVLTAQGIKPLLGVETYQAPITRYESYKAQRDKKTGWKIDNFHLLLLAQNDEGLKNLYRMISEAHGTGFYHHGRVDWDLLAKYNKGIIATSACGSGMLPQALAGNPHIPDETEILQKYLAIFGDRFYIELSTYPAEWQQNVNVMAAGVANNFGVPVVYANDAHYATPDQYELHEAIYTLSNQKKLKDLEGPNFEPALYIMGEEEVREKLSYLPVSTVAEAMSNSDAIAEMCDASLPENRKRLPIFVPEGYKTTREMFLDIVEKQYEKKIVSYNKDESLYWPRIEKELGVIFGAGLVDYFLMVRDYVYWAKRNGIMVGPGRGSVGGSLIAYLLGITEVDPIRYGLIFERFYNAGREKSLPDIDIDFSKEGRDKVKEYIRDKYGAEYVADLGTTIRLQPKSAINDMGRVMSVPPPVTKAISKIIDKAIDAGLQPNWPTILAEHGDELQKYMDEYPKLFEFAIALAQTDKKLKDDQPKTYGVHASGVIVGDEPLSAVFPLRWVSNEKKLVTQWDMRVADQLGFMKGDILGLRNFDTLTELNRILVENEKPPIDFEAVQYETHPEALWEQFDHGLTVGLFQIEDGGSAKQLARQVKPRSVDDLAVLVAMNRPGVLRAHAHERYLHGRNGGVVDYIHPLVEAVSLDTFGEFIYQEQVIEFFTNIGYSLEEADDIRALMGKKKREELETQYPLYLAAATKHMSETMAARIWEILQGFALYAFNKSHSVEYGLILLWTAYAKYHYPLEFLVASIRTVAKDQKSRYVREAQRMGYEVYAPMLGEARWNASLRGDGIMLGWSDVQDFGETVAKWMERNTTEGMTRDEFEAVRKEKKFVAANGARRIIATAKHMGVLDRLGVFADYGDVEVMRKEDRIVVEEELLGVALSDDSATILLDHEDVIAEYCTPYDMTNEEGEEYAIAGVIRTIENKTTKNGKPYAVVKVADAVDEAEFYVWNEELKRLGFIWRQRVAGVFNVKRNSHGLSLKDAAILYPKDSVNTKYGQRSKEVL